MAKSFFLMSSRQRTFLEGTCLHRAESGSRKNRAAGEKAQQEARERHHDDAGDRQQSDHVLVLQKARHGLARLHFSAGGVTAVVNITMTTTPEKIS